MLRVTVFRIVHCAKNTSVFNRQLLPVVTSGMPIQRYGHGEPDIHSTTFDSLYEQFFDRVDIDGWEIRKGMNDILGMDVIPDPKIVISALKACRRVNDYALAVRWLEGVKCSCGNKKTTIYPWIIQEIRPTLDELGVSTPEEMGYACPELGLKSVYGM